jgi:tRNA-2-methylthio-N6-dimethylallyladenosine synthase
MNRKYSKDHYLNLISKIKKEIPGIALTTDIIVGFPGETDEDFEETLDVVRKVKFDMAFTFLYSKRKGTLAYNMPEKIPSNVINQRFDKLIKLQAEISKEINNKLFGKEVEVLVEGKSKRDKSKYSGRTRTNKLVHFDGNDNLIGNLVTVRIESVKTWSLEGIIIKE